MPGQAGLNGDFSRFGIADFANHDDVRVLAQYRAEPSGEGQIYLGIYLDLADPLDLVFDRIFDGDDVFFAGIDPVQRGVESRRLAAAGRPGHEDDAARPCQHSLQRPYAMFPQTDVGQGEDPLFLVQQAQHGPLSVVGRNDRDADIDIAAGDQHPDAAVLRQAFFGDVETGHDLDARDQRILDDFGGRKLFVEDAVDAEADQQIPFVRFDMDVADPLLDRFRENRVEQADNRSLIGQIQQILGVVQFGGNRGEIFPLQLLQHFAGRPRGTCVDNIDDVRQKRGRHQYRFERLAEQQAQFVKLQHPGGAGYRDPDDAVNLAQRQDRVGTGKRQREAIQQFGIDLISLNFRSARYSEPVGNGLQLASSPHVAGTHLPVIPFSTSTGSLFLAASPNAWR